VTATRGVQDLPRSEIAAQRNGFKAIMYLFAVSVQVAEKNFKEALPLGGVKSKKVRGSSVDMLSRANAIVVPQATKAKATKKDKHAPVAAVEEEEDGDTAAPVDGAIDELDDAFDWPGIPRHGSMRHHRGCNVFGPTLPVVSWVA